MDINFFYRTILNLVFFSFLYVFVYPLCNVYLLVLSFGAWKSAHQIFDGLSHIIETKGFSMFKSSAWSWTLDILKLQ